MQHRLNATQRVSHPVSRRFASSFDLSVERVKRHSLPYAWEGRGPPPVSAWRHLKTYRIPFAQPSQTTPTDLRRSVSLGEGLYVCGDHRAPATFDGAMMSGRLAAEAVIADM